MAKAIKNPNGPATKRQTYALFLLTKTDFRPMNLTVQEASDMIIAFMDRNAKKNAKVGENM
jgi:hypothetical protein